MLQGGDGWRSAPPRLARRKAKPGRFTLIETAKSNDVEPFAYLEATLEATASATCHPQSRVGDLFPWNFRPSS